MADRRSHLPGDLDVLQSDRNRSQSTVLLPPSPLERVSTYCPQKDLASLRDSKLDPFYLEQSLPGAVPLESERDVGPRESRQYYTLPAVNTGKRFSVPSLLAGSMRPRYSQTQSDDNRPAKPPTYSADSFSSQSESIPDLTPSSSFSSEYSPYPESVKHTKTVRNRRSRRTPTSDRSKSPTSASPTPTQTPKLSGPAANQSTETVTMHARKQGYSNRGKPLPSLPNITGTHERRKGSDSGGRPQIEPSMISPPSLINPITLEPHTSHFDQAFFIPAHECPSPVPSPTTASPPFSKQTHNDRPSTSLEAYGEQSVWESDSDTESVGRKSLSKKPIDTLRKVRSRAKLRVAKSAPKLNPSRPDDEQSVESLPSAHKQSHEEPHPHSSTPVPAHNGKGVFHPSWEQTLRLVAPSATSLVRPPSRRDNPSRDGHGEGDMDRSTAAAMQAKSRRRQRSDTPETESSETEKPGSLCRDQYSDSPDDGSSLSRAPFLRRFWSSLQLLSCRTGPRSDKAAKF